MLCIAYHPFLFSHTSVSIWKYNGLQWQLTCIPNAHTQTRIQVELSHTWALQNTVPNRRGSFLNITIISLYCNARTDWLSPGATNTDPPRVIQEVGSRRGDAIFTQTHASTHTQPLLHSETKQHILQTPLPTITLPPNPRLSCLIWLTTIVERQSPFPSVFKMAVGTALVLTAVWELSDNELNCMKLSEA